MQAFLETLGALVLDGTSVTVCPSLYLSLVVRNRSSGFPSKTDTKQAVEPHKRLEISD